MLLEEIYRKSIILITNYYDWLIDIDQRIKSRLTPDTVEFKTYNEAETRGILKQRMRYAFHPGVWEDEAFNVVAVKTAEIEDIRSGMFLMKESGAQAESAASRKVHTEHVKKAIEKLDDFTIKNSNDLEGEARDVLQLVKENSGKRMGELHKIYVGKGGKSVYRTFQRKINHLAKNKFVTLTKLIGGKEGNTTIVKYEGATRKLSDFS